MMAKPRRSVLITGAGGFVGRALTRGFADLDWIVIALDQHFDEDDPGQGGHAAPGTIVRLTADLAAGVPADVSSVDVVLHAAWITAEPADLGMDTGGYIELNLRPLRHILDFARSSEVSDFVFLSSSGVFGPDDAATGLRDTDQPTGSSAYGAAKRAGEELVLGAMPSSHVMRLGYLFGPDEAPSASRPRASLIAHWVAAVASGRTVHIRSDDPARDWTYTRDLAPAIARLLESGAAGHPIHLASPYVYRDSAIAELIASLKPDATMIVSPAEGRLKPPMVPSDNPALSDFEWTDPADGIRALLHERVPA